MDAHRAAVCTLFALGALIALYWATSKSEDSLPVPEIQTEADVMGLGVSAGVGSIPAHGRNNAGTPLDMRGSIHFWAPGFNDAGCLDENHPTVKSRHSYPAVTGGNMSTVMHKGWSAFMTSAPANNDWRICPPEVAII